MTHSPSAAAAICASEGIWPFGEDVFLDPRIGGDRGAIAADGVEEEQPVGPQQLTRLLQIGAVVAHADVLEHAERVDGIEVAAHAAVVLQQDVDRQSRTAFLRRQLLILRDGDARHRRHRSTRP